jgi:hypothetical protein
MHALLLAVLLTTAPPEMEVQTLDGQRLVGSLVELSSTQITIELSNGRTSLDTDKLLGVTPKHKPTATEQPPGVWLDLVDGSSLLAQEYAVHDRQAQVQLLDGERVAVPTHDVGAVRLQAATDAVAAEWARILSMKFDGDLLVVRKGDSLDYHKGVLHDVSDKAVQFELDGETISVKRAKVFALAYYHAANRQLPGPVCRVTDAAGSRWSVRTIALADNGTLQWTTPTGVQIAQPVASVANIDFSGGKIVFLSDLKPESVKWMPYFPAEKATAAMAELYAPRQDQNLQSKPLQLDGKQYPKGLALHSRTEMIYRLPDRFSRLKATVGIDDGVRPHGNVRLVIRSDEKVLFEAAIVGDEPAKMLDLDIGGARRLTILADFGTELGVADHLDLCNARIVK